jgi:phosphoenolpyruvate synthase/pyruvate phosphate dikinase
VFDTGRVEDFKRKGDAVVLLREHTETADIEALSRTEALVTAHGARTSHAAVVARQLGKVCLVGCHLLKIDAGGRSGSFGEVPIQEGELITVDGSSGLAHEAGEAPRGNRALARFQPTPRARHVSRPAGWTAIAPLKGRRRPA